MRTRFAPSPTGPLHLGHAFSALTAFDLARAHAGEFVLRIEDIDRSRARDSWEEQIYDDLKWLGLSWTKPVMRQSNEAARYDAALDHLWSLGLLYPCTCNRRDIQSAMSAPQEGAPMGPDGLVYPGTCRNILRPKARPRNVNLRLDMGLAIGAMSELTFTEHVYEASSPRQIEIEPETILDKIGDVVLSRRDMGTSYHLSVVLDDAAQEITDVVRGEDLFEATTIHVLLQKLMAFPTPQYHHHRLLRDDTGKRLAKRDDARAISLYRREGLSPADLKKLVGLGLWLREDRFTEFGNGGVETTRSVGMTRWSDLIYR